VLDGEAGRIPENLFLDEDGWVRSQSGDDESAEICRLDEGQALSIIGTVATLNSTVVHEGSPRLEAELIFGDVRFRFTAAVPPKLVRSPVFAFRYNERRIIPLSEYVTTGVLTGEQAENVMAAIRSRLNILICGEANTGKTTFLKACLQYKAAALPGRRTIIIEDTRELVYRDFRGISLCAVDDPDPNKRVTLAGCVRLALRLSPTSITIGEVRGREAYELLKAWDTGHSGGLATLHAAGAEEALYRLQEMIRRPSGLHLISRTVHLVVFLAGTGKNRTVKEIARVRPPERGRFVAEFL
jgi:type IV secretion system protein VirB11